MQVHENLEKVAARVVLSKPESIGQAGQYDGILQPSILGQ